MKRLRLIVLVACSALLIQASAQEKPKKHYELYEEAEKAYNTGKYNDALTLLNTCLTYYPGYYEAYALRGSVREILKDLDGALTDFSIFLEQYPAHVDVLMSRAVLRYKIGFYEQAKEDFQLLLVLEPAETNSIFYRQNMAVGDTSPMLTTQGAHKSYVLNYLGLTASKLQDFSQAISFFDSAILLNSREPDYFVNRGLAREAVQDTAGAAGDYQKALVLNPAHTLARHNLAALQAGTGAADRLTETIMADSTMLYPYLERAVQRFEAGYFKGAIEDYTSALEIEKSDAEIWLGRGLAREKVKDFEGAFSDYTRAIDIRENFFKAWINRGNVLFKLERYQDAIEDFSVALVYQPNYAAAFYNRAMAKAKLKHKAEACEDLKLAQAQGMEIERKVWSKICED